MLATTNGWAIMLSTPWDKSHIFYRAFTSPLWSKYHFPSSVNPLITKDFLEEQLELNGQQAFDQEYMAEFIEDAKSYFPMPLLRSCVHVCKDNAKECEYCWVLSDFSKLVAAERPTPTAGLSLLEQPCNMLDSEQIAWIAIAALWETKLSCLRHKANRDPELNLMIPGEKMKKDIRGLSDRKARL